MTKQEVFQGGRVQLAGPLRIAKNEGSTLHLSLHTRATYPTRARPPLDILELEEEQR